MHLGGNFGSSAPLRTVFFTLVTLLAWTTAASLFIVLKRAPLTRGASATTYYAALCGLIPWLAGCVSWAKVRKRAKSGIADKDATGFCYSIIIAVLISAYVAMVSLETVLLWVLTRVH
jgi:hypothetical protein